MACEFTFYYICILLFYLYRLWSGLVCQRLICAWKNSKGEDRSYFSVVVLCWGHMTQTFLGFCIRLQIELLILLLVQLLTLKTSIGWRMPLTNCCLFAAGFMCLLIHGSSFLANVRIQLLVSYFHVIALSGGCKCQITLRTFGTTPAIILNSCVYVTF